MAAAHKIRRLGIVAAGLGIGAALAASPGTATADTSTEWWSLIDGVAAGLPAATTPDIDLAISFDGINLLTTGNAAATTGVGEYGLAIAYGDGAFAYASGGVGNLAFADGTNATAVAGGAGGDIGNDYNVAINVGNNSSVGAIDSNQGAFAINSDLSGSGGLTVSHNLAIDIGNNTNSTALFEGAISGQASASSTSDYNTAIDIGNNSGDFNGAVSTAGSHSTSIAVTNYLTGDHYAGTGGDHDIAAAIGPADSTAFAGGDGDNDIAVVFDPFGATASDATAQGGFHDLAAVLFTDGNASVIGVDNFYDILTAMGHETGTFPTFISTLLTDLGALLTGQ